MSVPQHQTLPSVSPGGLPVIAVVGDGQLARMMQTAAIELGYCLRILASDPGQSAAQVIPSVVLGDYITLSDVRRAAAGASVVTFEHEHVPQEVQHALIDEGLAVHPRPEALLYAQDKLMQRRTLHDAGLPVPPFAALESVADVERLWDDVGGEVCLKVCRGGYDGHGVWFPSSREEAAELTEEILASGRALMGEQKVRLRRELSAMVARTPSGQCADWPVVESVQKDGICSQTIAPAVGLPEKAAETAAGIARHIAELLDVTGVLAVELFESEEGEILINELAMRPHNTGHWTQDGCVTSQFEQHLRAVADMPLGSTALRSAHTVMVNVLGASREPQGTWEVRQAEVWKRYPQAKIHLYGKSYRPGRKLGHVNVTGNSDVESLINVATSCALYLAEGRWPNVRGAVPTSV